MNSPFEVVNGFNPETPMDLSPLPQPMQVSQSGANKAEFVKNMHRRLRENIEKKAEKNRAKHNKGRQEVIFKPGDWVWLHMRPERFPDERKSKLSPRGDGPFRVLEKINNNAYRLELPGEFKVSPTFNVADLAPYVANDEEVLRTEPFQGVGDIVAPQAEVPQVRKGPTTRSGAQVIRAGFTKAVQDILEQDQTGFKQLLIQEMAELKLEDPTYPAEVQDPSGSIQFSSIDHSQAGLMISTFSLDPSVLIDPGLEA